MLVCGSANLLIAPFFVLLPVNLKGRGRSDLTFVVLFPPFWPYRNPANKTWLILTITTITELRNNHDLACRICYICT